MQIRLVLRESFIGQSLFSYTIFHSAFFFVYLKIFVFSFSLYVKHKILGKKLNLNSLKLSTTTSKKLNQKPRGKDIEKQKQRPLRPGDYACKVKVKREHKLNGQLTMSTRASVVQSQY